MSLRGILLIVTVFFPAAERGEDWGTGEGEENLWHSGPHHSRGREHLGGVGGTGPEDLQCGKSHTSLLSESGR